MRPVKLPKFKVCLMKYISMGSKMGTSELFMFDAYFKKHKKNYISKCALRDCIAHASGGRKN